MQNIFVVFSERTYTLALRAKNSNRRNTYKTIPSKVHIHSLKWQQTQTLIKFSRANAKCVNYSREGRKDSISKWWCNNVNQQSMRKMKLKIFKSREMQSKANVLKNEHYKSNRKHEWKHLQSTIRKSQKVNNSEKKELQNLSLYIHQTQNQSIYWNLII